MVNKNVIKQGSPKIGELLVKEGFITKKDLKKALVIQKREASEAALPFGDLLVKTKFLDKSQLEILKEHPDMRKPIGEMLVDRGFITTEELEKHLGGMKKHEVVGQLLVKKEIIDKDELEEILESQKEALDIGELAVRLQMMSEIDLVRAQSFRNSQRTIGEILCDLGIIRPEDLNQALSRHKKRLKIGETLINQGVIDDKQFQTATEEQGHTNERLGQILIRKKFVTSDQLYNALSRQHNIPYRELNEFYYDEGFKRALIKFVGEKYARRNLIVPLTLEGHKLMIGMSYPEGFDAISDLKDMYSELDMRPVFITEKKFRELFGALYNKGFEMATEGVDPLGDAAADVLEIDLEEMDAGTTKGANLYGGTDTAVKGVVDYIIKHGIVHGASDIHLEQDREGIKLRYRIDGMCQEPDIEWLKSKLEEMPGAIISRIKVMSNLDIAERRMPQDGVFRIKYREKDRRFDLDFRVATCPAIVGENITIRILDSRKANLGLDNLNHSKHVLDPLKRLFKSAAGMILVSGPTGSGKSSTLYGALKYVYHPGIKIITAEDPIEYSFPGIMQTQVNTKINLSFARLLRSFLRLDPDVILVGEIRDNETATIGFDAAQTGHLLLSTIHTNDAVSAVSRLLDLDVEYNQIASSLMGVVAQRLVRRNCRKCSRPFKPPRAEWSLFFNEYPDHVAFHKGIGCTACDFTGYSGRTLISELFEVNRDIALALSRGATEKELKRLAFETGMKTMIDDGMTKMNQTTLSELIRVTPVEMIKEFSARQRGQMNWDEESSGLNGNKTVIHDPASQTDVITELYNNFAARKYGNEKVDKEEVQIFQDFIAESFREISQKHGCKSVDFYIDSEGDRVMISAAPEKE
ncbi:MAG: Flp pilus assembly complex ATPase component TadA [Desulfobacteraceae bacterium]|nr:Flp pilus assembly complex ATPase component TadA [Desulfobacteraceae bacterium]